jgi:dual-specificity kinase
LKGFLDLLQKMLVYDPVHRITAKQALKHPWFRESVRDDGTEAARLASENPEMLRRGARKQSSALPP